ncbi:MAG: hypothetical protein V1915_03610 [Candidatus Bathyarchaeota archaeon]
MTGLGRPEWDQWTNWTRQRKPLQPQFTTTVHYPGLSPPVVPSESSESTRWNQQMKQSCTNKALLSHLFPSDTSVKAIPGQTRQPQGLLRESPGSPHRLLSRHLPLTRTTLGKPLEGGRQPFPRQRQG